MLIQTQKATDYISVDFVGANNAITVAAGDRKTISLSPSSPLGNEYAFVGIKAIAADTNAATSLVPSLVSITSNSAGLLTVINPTTAPINSNENRALIRAIFAKM